jgi:hypothetical protein
MLSLSVSAVASYQTHVPLHDASIPVYVGGFPCRLWGDDALVGYMVPMRGQAARWLLGLHCQPALRDAAAVQGLRHPHAREAGAWVYAHVEHLTT